MGFRKKRDFFDVVLHVLLFFVSSFFFVLFVSTSYDLDLR